MDVLVDAGGSIHRLEERTATMLAENLRVSDSEGGAGRTAADKLERELVERSGEPLVFTSAEGVQICESLDRMMAIKALGLDTPDLEALFRALLGRD